MRAALPMLLGVLFLISGAVRATTLIELSAAGEPVRRKQGDGLRMLSIPSGSAP